MTIVFHFKSNPYPIFSMILTEHRRWMIFISRDETTREFLRQQLKSDDVTSLSHQLSSRYSIIVEHTEDCRMVVKATRMDRVGVFEFLKF